MIIYEFAPSRLSQRNQKRVQIVVGVILIALLAIGFAISLASVRSNWIQILVTIGAVGLTATFSYPVSSIDRLFAFGLTASILATLGPYPNPWFTISAWTLGVLLGQWALYREFLLAASSALCLWFASSVLVWVWIVTDAALVGVREQYEGYADAILDLHLVPIVVSLIAFYLARSTISSVRAILFTKLSLKEILLRISWSRVSLMLVAECVVAIAVVVFSSMLNTFVFQRETPYGTTFLIIVIATTAFGFATQRQLRTANERLESLTGAALKLPWPENVPVFEQALTFARQALPRYQVSAYETVRETSRDHIHSKPIQGDGAPVTLFALRRPGQPPFKLEDQRALTAIAQVANETIRARREVRNLRKLANTDRLTGLLNYRAFQATLNDLSGWHRADDLIALIFIDVDNFKAINDNYGHEVGNLVLQTVAGRIKAAVDEDTLVARVGGDEFVVLLQRLPSRTAAERVQAALREHVGQPIDVEGTMISLRISQGIAFSTPGQQDLTPLVELADRRMYESRGNRLDTLSSNGRFDPPTRNEPGVVLALREGIVQKRLDLVYQPIVDLDSQTVVALEALLRYTDPEHGPQDVHFMLNEAERLGLLPQLSTQVLELCVEGIQRIRQRYPELQRMHLNVTLAQLLDAHFTKLVNQLTEEYPGIDLVLEVNEDSLKEITPDVIQRIDAFSERSRSILSIDDIGQGYTGLASLRDFPAKVWKVDRSIIKQFSHERSEPLVRGLMRTAEALEVQVIFEGIETEQQHAWLLEIGARYGQGFLYGRPVSLDELLLRFESVGVAARL